MMLNISSRIMSFIIVTIEPSYTTGATSEAETTYSSGAPGNLLVFKGRVALCCVCNVHVSIVYFNLFYMLRYCQSIRFLSALWYH